VNSATGLDYSLGYQAVIKFKSLNYNENVGFDVKYKNSEFPAPTKRRKPLPVDVNVADGNHLFACIYSTVNKS